MIWDCMIYEHTDTRFGEAARQVAQNHATVYLWAVQAINQPSKMNYCMVIQYIRATMERAAADQLWMVGDAEWLWDLSIC